jgi:hypothetical protein
MNTHDSAATSMNKIIAAMRTALSEFQGMRVPFKTMRTPVHFANYTRYDVVADWVCARSHPEKTALRFPIEQDGRLRPDAVASPWPPKDTRRDTNPG